MKRNNHRIPSLILALAVLGIGVLGSRNELWSSTATPASSSTGLFPNANAQSVNEGETLQEAFIRIGEQVGPAVVSISTEQIDRVKQYMRVHPFFGEEPMVEEFFRQFYGYAPERHLRRFGLGSGVIIDARGFILTNEHVVADADKITVTLADGREFIGEVKGKDPRSDLAIIKIEASELPVVKLGDSAVLKAGQWVVALGNPLGLAGMGHVTEVYGAEPTISVGVISALNRQLPQPPRFDRDYAGLIQTDATINPGNSGGPLVNLQGEVIGVNVAIIAGAGNAYGFAIPINKAKNILESLIEGKRVVYGWLGIEIQDITHDVAEYYGLQENEGVLVYRVVPGSPADKGGIHDGDIIKSFAGTPTENARALIDRVGNTPAGSSVDLEIIREGKPQHLTVVIGERPSELSVTEEVTSDVLWRGLKVAPITPETAEQFGVSETTQGVIVVEIEPGSSADTSGLRIGDVINEIKGMSITNGDDYQKATAQVRGNALVRTNRGYVVLKAGG